MSSEQLSVRIEDDQLIIEGERTGPSLHMSQGPARAPPPRSGPDAPAESAPRDDAAAAAAQAQARLYPVRELKYGKFRREIPLPAGVNVSGLLVRCVGGELLTEALSFPGCACAQYARGRHASHLVASQPVCVSRTTCRSVCLSSWRACGRQQC